jgi:hypothetical protein
MPFYLRKARGSLRWFMILNYLGPFWNRRFLIFAPGVFMRSLLALISCASILSASSALAETRVFIIANQAASYGVDQCLAKGEKCGAQVARSYCQSRDFAQASAYRRVDPDEITGSVPKSGANCSQGHCDEYVAITCQR